MQFLLIQIGFILGSFTLISLFLYFYYRNKDQDKRQEFKKSTLILITATLVLFILGSVVKNSMAKKEVLKYFDKGISYKQMDDTQKYNVETTIFKLDKIPKEDRSKYLEAYTHYMREYYESKNTSEEDIEKNIEKFIDKKID